MHNLNGIAEFVAAVDLGSFVTAGRHVGMTPSGVSKAVKRLESRLGARLLNRTTRRLTLTNSGVTFYQRCRQVLADLQEAEAAVGSSPRLPSGTLRIDVPVEFGRTFIVPALPQFMKAYPELVVQAVLRPLYADLVNQNVDFEIVDLAVRLGEFNLSILPGKKIGQTRAITCASPDYLKRCGQIERPEHLLHHNCLRYLSPYNWKIRDWRFSEGRSMFSMALNGNMVLSTTDSLVQSAIAGEGVIQVHDYIVAPAIKKGLLTPILEKWMAPPRPILILLPKQKSPSANVNAFTTFLSTILPSQWSGLDLGS